MMRLYFSPECVKPPFLSDDKTKIKQCWAMDGLFYAIFLVVLIFVSWTYYRAKTPPELNPSSRTFVILSAIIVIVVPYLFWFSGGNLWEGYRLTMKSLIDQGFTKKEAINFLQGIDDSNRKSDGRSPSSSRFASTKSEDEKNEIEKNKNE
jgi:hypothetical protein